LSISFDEENFARCHKLNKGFWCKASTIAQQLGIRHFVDALAVFVQIQRGGSSNGLWFLTDEQKTDSSSVSSLYVSLHPSLTCWKPSGKNSSNLTEMEDEKIRCTPRWLGKKEWRNDHVWINSNEEEAEGIPLRGRVVGQVKIIVTIFDPQNEWQKLRSVEQLGASLTHCGALIETLRPVNNGIPHEIHGMIEFKSWGQSFTGNTDISLRGLKLYPMAAIIRSAHVIPSNRAGIFYVNNYIDWEQFNNLYYPQSRETEYRRAVKESNKLSEHLKHKAVEILEAKKAAEEKKEHRRLRLLSRLQKRPKRTGRRGLYK
jgi:hypothetical protein